MSKRREIPKQVSDRALERVMQDLFGNLFNDGPLPPASRAARQPLCSTATASPEQLRRLRHR